MRLLVVCIRRPSSAIGRGRIALPRRSRTGRCSMGIMRRRMRRRVLVAGAATGAVAYHAGKKHAQQDQEVDESQGTEQPTTDYAPAPPADAGPDGADLEEIQKLAELHQSGALTDEEFAVAKSKLLA